MTLRGVISGIESYEPPLGMTEQAVAAFQRRDGVSTSVLRYELERLHSQPDRP